MLEKTLVLVKPDALCRGLSWEIISRLERVWLKIVWIKMVAPTKEFYHHHYETIWKVISRRGQEVFDSLMEMMMSAPVIALAVEGVNSADLMRKISWATQSSESAPWTIRGDFSHMTYAHCDANNAALPNVVHASGDSDEAKLEIKHWFSEDELFSYQRADQQFTILAK